MTNNLENQSTFFAPMLSLKNVADALEFYKKAFNAAELRRWSNDDGSIHVAEISIDGALFHLHEEVTRTNELSPQSLNGTCVVIGMFVDDPDAVSKTAIEAGAEVLSPIQDYDYGYRQVTIADPFGHHWQIQKKI